MPVPEKDFAWNLFINLREELVGLQRLRAQMVGVKLTLVTTAIGLIASQELSPLLFVLPPIAASFFDVVIESYSSSIKGIGRYCRKHLEPIFRSELTLPGTFLLWEEFIAQEEKKRWVPHLGNFGITLLASLPAIVVFTTQRQLEYKSPLSVLLGASLLLSLCLVVIPFCRAKWTSKV